MTSFTRPPAPHSPIYTIDGHREAWPVRSKRFRGWLRHGYYQATGSAASAAEVRSALDLLEARAQFDGPERGVHVRIAEHAGHIYLDLADEHWRAVNIGPDGWRVIGCPAVRFRRPAGMLPLPEPEQGGWRVIGCPPVPSGPMSTARQCSSARSR